MEYISINVPTALGFLYAKKQCRQLSKIFELHRLILNSAKNENIEHLIDVTKKFEGIIKQKLERKEKDLEQVRDDEVKVKLEGQIDKLKDDLINGGTQMEATSFTILIFCFVSSMVFRAWFCTSVFF